MSVIHLTPGEREAAIGRLRSLQPTALDIAWMRVTPDSISYSSDTPPRLAPVRYLCDCRCTCHAGACGRTIDLGTLDCPRACRSAHMLASDCDLDATRERRAVHV